jgi:predicted transcriptional regulator
MVPRILSAIAVTFDWIRKQLGLSKVELARRLGVTCPLTKRILMNLSKINSALRDRTTKQIRLAMVENWRLVACTIVTTLRLW